MIGDGGAGGECFGIAVEGEIDVAEAFVDVAEGAIGVGGGVDAGVAGFDGGEEHGFGFVGGGDFVHELAEHETGGGVVFVVADGLDEGGDGAAALAGGVEGGGELEPGRGIGWGEAEKAIEDWNRVGEFFLVQEAGGEFAEEARLGGVGFDGALQDGEDGVGFVGRLLLFEAGEIEPGIGEMGMELESGFVGFAGGVGLLRLAEDVAEAVVEIWDAALAGADGGAD